MKKFITFILCLFGLLAMAQDDNSHRFPLWLQELQNRTGTRKVLRDGQLYLNYNGHIYDVRGTRLQ